MSHNSINNRSTWEFGNLSMMACKIFWGDEQVEDPWNFSMALV